MAERGNHENIESQQGIEQEANNIQSRAASTQEAQERILISIPKNTRKDVLKYLTGFTRLPSTPPLSEAQLTGKKRSGDKSREQVESEQAYLKYLLKSYAPALKKGEETDPSELIRYLQSRAVHKIREVLGYDRNVRDKPEARKRAHEEFQRLNSWIVSMGGEEISSEYSEEEREQREKKPVKIVHTSYLKEIKAGSSTKAPPTTAGSSTEPPPEEQPPKQPTGPPQDEGRKDQPPPTPPEEPPPAETKESPEQHEQKIIEDCRIISDQIIMNHFPVEIIEAMHREGKTEKEINESWVEAALKYFENITIHRQGKRRQDNPLTGEKAGDDYGDIDGNSTVALLKRAGVRVNLNFVNAGDYEKGRINIDTGYKPGQAVGAEGENIKYDVFNPVPDRLTVFWDHHGENAPRDKCSTMLAHERLTRLGLLDDSQGIQSAVYIVNQIDNGFQPLETYQDSHKTIWGLAPEMKFEDIVDFFENGGTPNQPLSPEQLKKYQLVNEEHNRNVPKEIQRYIGINQRELASMKRQGRIVPSKYGALGIGKIRWEARGENINATLNWDPKGEGDRFTFSSVDDFRPETIEFFKKHGIPITKSNMANKIPVIIPGPIPFSLGEFLVDHLGVSSSEIKKSETLRKLLNEDQERVEKLRERK